MSMYPFDGRDHISGKFYVDGQDETNAPELAGLGRRRLVGVVAAVALLFVVGLLWTHEVTMAVVVVLAGILQAGVVVFFATERIAVGAIRRRREVDAWRDIHPMVQE